MQSSWPAADFHQVNPKGLVEKIGEMTGGRPPGGPAAGRRRRSGLRGPRRGEPRRLLDAGHSWPGFWTGKHPAATLFGSAPGGPYGMNSEDYLGWIYLGGGLELYNELLQKELKMNVVVFPTFGETPGAAGVVPQAAQVGRRTSRGSSSAPPGSPTGSSRSWAWRWSASPRARSCLRSSAAWWRRPSSAIPSADMAYRPPPGAEVLPHAGHPPADRHHGAPGQQGRSGTSLPADVKAIVKHAAMAEALHYTRQDARSQQPGPGDAGDQARRHCRRDAARGLRPRSSRPGTRSPSARPRRTRSSPRCSSRRRPGPQRVVPYRRCCHPPYEFAADYYWKGANPYKIPQALRRIAVRGPSTAPAAVRSAP